MLKALCEMSMKHFYTYGTKESSFEKLKEDISQLFNVELQEHESGWWGIYAMGETPQIKEVKLYPNFVEGEGFHEDEGGYSYLLAISYPENPYDIPGLVSSSQNKFQLIRHNEL